MSDDDDDDDDDDDGGPDAEDDTPSRARAQSGSKIPKYHIIPIRQIRLGPILALNCKFTDKIIRTCVYIYIYIYIYKKKTHIYIYIYMFFCICAYAYVCVRVCMLIWYHRVIS